MKKTLLAVLLTTMGPVFASAAPIRFDLRDLSLEAIDEVNSIAITEAGVTAVLTASPPSLGGFPLVLNQTGIGFGVDVAGTTCGGLEDSALLDTGCGIESIQLAFDQDVALDSLTVSYVSFAEDIGVVLGQPGFVFLITSSDITSTGVLELDDVLLPAGQFLRVSAFFGDFSLDSIAVTPVPEPTVLLLLATGVAAVARRRRHLRRS